MSCSSVFQKGYDVPHFVLVSTKELSSKPKLKIYEISEQNMTRMKIFSLDTLSVTSICTIEMPKLDKLLQSWALIAVCGRPKGKTVHLKVTYRPKTKKQASQPGLSVPYLFEMHKTNFTSRGNVNQIVASHSHDKLHLAFN